MIDFELLKEKIAQDLKYQFIDSKLFLSALRHPCLQVERTFPNDYERMEFLGDRVLGVVIADVLYHDYPNATEGELARSYTSLVKANALIKISQYMNLAYYLKLNGVADHNLSPNVLADTCEAMIAAVYLDGGMTAAHEFIHKNWDPLINNQQKSNKDPKSLLQEWSQANNFGTPEYKVVAIEGSDHNPIFSVEVVINGSELSAQASAKSKKTAEQLAATSLLNQVSKANDDSESFSPKNNLFFYL